MTRRKLIFMAVGVLFASVALAFRPTREPHIENILPETRQQPNLDGWYRYQLTGNFTVVWDNGMREFVNIQRLRALLQQHEEVIPKLIEGLQGGN